MNLTLYEFILYTTLTILTDHHQCEIKKQNNILIKSNITKLCSYLQETNLK